MYLVLEVEEVGHLGLELPEESLDARYLPGSQDALLCSLLFWGSRCDLLVAQCGDLVGQRL